MGPLPALPAPPGPYNEVGPHSAARGLLHKIVNTDVQARPDVRQNRMSVSSLPIGAGKFPSSGNERFLVKGVTYNPGSGKEGALT